MSNLPLMERRDAALGVGAELFYDEPLEIVRGEGVYLFDRQGRRFVDMYNNVQCVGHANEVVVRAMADQQATLNVHSRYLHEGIVNFGERLASLHHDGIESVVFSCSGTEANDVAIQIARLASGNRGLICSDAAYHGNSELVDSLSYLWSDPPQFGEVRAFPYPDCYRPLQEGLSEVALTEAYLQKVEQEIESLNAEGHGVAALIMCPIFANEGMPNIPEGFMAKVTDLVHKHGGLVIADEVQSGYGRTGVWWGYDKIGFTPDIVVTGKPMGNGLPLAATATSKSLIDAFRARRDYFNTCSSSPLQAAVGLAVIDEIERLNLIEKAAEVGARLTNDLKERMDRYSSIGDVRCYGLFISVEMVRDRETKEPDAKLVEHMCNSLMNKGFLVGYQGKYDNVLKIRPPLVFTHENAKEFLAAFDECMEELGG